MSSADDRERTADAIESLQSRTGNCPALLGFDGFVDEIVRLVDKKESADRYTPIADIPAFAERIARAAGKSTNIEMIVEKVKLGGNGPIMANAMAQFGFPITYIGNLGKPEVHPVFREFAKRATVYSIAEPGHTDALEFADGKIMLGKYQSLDHITYASIVATVGAQRLAEIWEESRFYALLNWTMIQHMTELWQELLARHCETDREKIVFFDLADPEKRTEADLRRALEVLAQFGKYYRTVLGCNEKESIELAQLFGVEHQRSDLEAIRRRAEALRRHIDVDLLVIHPVRAAAAASRSETAAVEGPYAPRPRISTGGGDHFNAGFCSGLLLGLDLTGALLTGVGTSGYYVRTVQSPTVPELASFLRRWEI